MDTPESTDEETIHKLNKLLSQTQNRLRQLPRSHPARSHGLYLLGSERLQCRELSHRNEELDLCILQLTEAILLPHRPWGEYRVNIIMIFFWLSIALFRRSKKSKRLDDVNSVIDYFHRLQDYSLEVHGISRNKVMVLLVEAFAIRASLGSEYMTQDIEYMIALCDELKQNSSADFTNKAHGQVYRNSAYGEPALSPIRLALSFALAASLASRFYETFSDDYYKEAIAILNRIIVSPSYEDSDELWLNRSSGLLAMAATFRSFMSGNPKNVEETVSYLHSLRCSSSDDMVREIADEAMELLEERRLDLFGIGIEKSPGLQEPVSRTPELVDASPSLRLDPPRGGVSESGAVISAHSSETLEERIHLLNERLSMISPGAPNYIDTLGELVDLYKTKVSLTDNTADIKEAIKHCRSLLRLIPGVTSSTFASISLAKLLERAFERTYKIEDINESIGLLCGALKAPMGQISCDTVFPILISSLLKRYSSSYGNQDIRDTIETLDEYYPLAAGSRYLSLPSRLRHSCKWARWSRGMDRPSVSTAYETAMSLMEDLVMLAPNLHLQHTTLVAKLGIAEQLPIDYASHLIHTDQLERGIETLERGRALLWSELRGFRSSVDQLSAVDTFLAQTFMAINRNLEKLTTSVLPSGKTELSGTGTEDSEGADPFGRLLLKQRKLLEGREWLISHIKTLSRWFYQSMLSQVGEEVPYHERSAGALRDAARELRDTKHVSLERRVNFVHYGA